jgi:ribosomal protein S18 acetylase RimI-like enzyme
MAYAIRRLDAGDVATLATLAADEPDFDVAGRSATRPLDGAAARAFLADPNVLFWVAEDASLVAGFLSCQLIRRRAAAPELLLYEIGVRDAHRRRGVGRALLETMTAHMTAHAIREAWVLADNAEAVAFYAACGFALGDGAAVYMVSD